MDFFSKNFPTISRIFSAAKKEVATTWSSIWNSGYGESRVTPASLMENDKNWVYVCVDKIADTASSIQLKLMKYNKSGMDTEVFDHPALDLLEHPNEQMTGRDFRYITMTHLELTGNAYWLKDNNGVPNSLFPLNPKWMSPRLSKDGMSIIDYKYSSPAQGVIAHIYNLDLIIHPKYPNPKNPLIGRGTLEPISEWVDVDNYQTEFNRRFFQNSATFGGAIKTNISDPVAMEKARMNFENTYKGIQNSHKFMLLPKDYELDDNAVTPRDMQMQQADATFRDKILAAFGVPKSVVGIVEDVNRANAESSNYVFMAFTVEPKINRLVTYLNEFYLPLFKGTDQMYFTYDDPVPENVSIEIQENQAALGNSPWMTVNEVRAKKGLPPVQDGDTVMTGSMLQPLGAIETIEPDDETEPEPAKFFQKGKRAPRVDKVARAVDSITDKVAKLFKEKAPVITNVAAQHRAFIDRVTHYEQEFEKAVRTHDQKQKQEVLAKSSGFTSNVSPTQLFDKEKEITKLIDVITPIVKKLTKDEGERATDLIAKIALNNLLKKEYSVSSQLEAIITRSIKRMARSYTQTTLNTLTDRINEGIKAGDPISKIADNISNVYGLTEEYRANRIARTEVFSAANDASKDAYRSSGVVKTIVWKTAEDELTCPYCAPMDNTVIKVDQSFFDKGDTVKGDDGETYDLNYEGVENPPLHPNCRCYILPGEITTTEKSIEETDEFADELKKLLHE